MRNGRLIMNRGLGRNCPRFIYEGGGREGGVIVSISCVIVCSLWLHLTRLPCECVGSSHSLLALQLLHAIRSLEMLIAY